MADKPNKRQQRAERTRKRLLRAAMRVFSQKGYHKTTLEEICKRANVAKGTIYQHFSNKKGLFLGLVDSRLNELGGSMADAVGETDDDLARLRAGVSAYMQFFEGHRNFYRLLIHEQSSFAKEIRERLRTKYFSHLRILEQVFRSGMKNGTVKRMDPTGATFALVGMCNATVFRWLICQKPHPLKKEVRLILEIFLRGISRESNRSAPLRRSAEQENRTKRRGSEAQRRGA